MSGRLTTHVLDTSRGCAAYGVVLLLTRLSPRAETICRAITNVDGRCDAPLIDGPAFIPGLYELVFDVGAYFARHHPVLPDPPFLNEIVLRFGVAAPGQHYHVPLLVSPYGYSTYRGS